jgi:hypothetical protein
LQKRAIFALAPLLTAGLVIADGTAAQAAPDGLQPVQTRQSLLGHHTWYQQTYRGIPVFGGDWCYDCHVLEYNFHKDPGLRALLEANYKVVNVDVGKYDKNLDLAAKYKMNLSKGVPALAVLKADGRVVYSDPGGFFEHARGMTKKEVAEFLEKWAPPRR